VDARRGQLVCSSSTSWRSGWLYRRAHADILSDAVLQLSPTPWGIAIHDGVVYVADMGNNRVRMVIP
jgi:hypothetical protein